MKTYILIKKSYSVVEVDPRSSSANTRSSISDSKDFVVLGVVSVEGQNISSEASWQSGVPSQTQWYGMQKCWLNLHLNAFSSQGNSP